MTKCAYGPFATLATSVLFSLLISIAPAQALSEKQCSEKYTAAKEAGTAGSLKWNEFRKAECGTDASMQPSKANVDRPSEAASVGIEECSVRYQSAKAAGTLGALTWNEFRKSGCPTMAAATTPGPAYSEQKLTEAAETKVNEKECSVKYRAAKEANTLGGMKWNEFRKAGCPDMAAVTTPAPAYSEQNLPASAAETKQASKMSEKECSVKYRAAKEANTLGGMKWKEFRKAGCPTLTANAGGSMLPTMGSIFPSGIAPKYASFHAGKARRRTCLDQYRANKAAGIAQIKWTEKGGGYYSECNRRLKQH